MDSKAASDPKVIVVFVKDADGNLLFEKKYSPLSSCITFRLNRTSENSLFVIGLKKSNGKKIQTFNVKPVVRITNEIVVEEIKKQFG